MKLWLLAIFVTLIIFIETGWAGPMPFKDELKTNFNLNDQRISEVGDLMDQIRIAASKRYKDGKADRNEQANDNNNEIPIVKNASTGGGVGGSTASHISTASIGVGHPNFSLPLPQYLFEGDIILTPVQANSILRKLLIENNFRIWNIRNKRAVISSDLDGRWTVFPIRYDFDPLFNQDDRALITAAVDFWGSNTCLSFSYVPGVNSGDYLNFFPGQGCYSMIGKQGGKQSVSLGDGCVQMGVITHEVGHALGLWHEQSRPDADGYVRIIPDNVIDGLLYNFLQRSWGDVLTYNIPYDLGSVMHYGGTAFSVDYNKNTIETVLPAYQRTIGQREHPSFYDVKIMNEAYCNNSCPASLPCQYGGYPHPDHCEKCICPDGLGGQYCDQPADAISATCGGLVYVNNKQWTNISSPGYPQPGFTVGQQCSWLFRSDVGTRIILQFIESFQFICSVTCLDYVEVKNDTDFGNTGMRFCCYEAPKYPIYSVNNEMIVIFRATTSKDVGFKAQVQQYPPDPNQQPTTGGANILTTRSTRSTNSRVPSTSSTTSVTTTTSTTTSSSTSTTTTPTTTITTSTQASTAVATEQPDVFNAWSAWSECTRTCGACGVKARSRTCANFRCVGELQQYKRCAFDICPSDTLCTQLQFRDTPCGSGKDKICSNAHEVTVKCSFPSCCEPFAPQDGYCRLTSWANTSYSSWGKWSAWGDCLGSKCGGCALRARIRACEDDSCVGSDTEYERCNTNACTDCANRPGQWIVGDCENGKKDQCIRPRTSSDVACPCCAPLVNKNGICASN